MVELDTVRSVKNCPDGVSASPCSLTSLDDENLIYKMKTWKYSVGYQHSNIILECTYKNQLIFKFVLLLSNFSIRFFPITIISFFQGFPNIPYFQSESKNK